MFRFRKPIVKNPPKPAPKAAPCKTCAKVRAALVRPLQRLKR